MSNKVKLKTPTDPKFIDQDSLWMAIDVAELKPPLYSKAFILFLFSFLVVGVFYSAVTKVPISVESAGRLANEKPAIPIRAGLGFTVANLIVKENQIVSAGESLLSTKEGLKPQEIILIKELNKELQFLNSKNALIACQECTVSLAKSLKLFDALEGSKKLIAALKPAAVTAKTLGLTLIKLKDVDKKLQGYKTRIVQLSQPQNGGRMPASVTPARKAEMASLQEQMNKQYAPYVQNIQKLQDDMRVRSKTISDGLDEWLKNSAVQAPLSGKVVNIRIRGEGEVIGGGQPIMEIVPLENKLVAQIEVPNRDIGAIKIGDSVDVSVDAFPEADFGFIKGEIQEILPMESTDFLQNGPERGFRVRVSLKTQGFESGKVANTLLPGMTIRTRIQKKNETLLKSFYRSVFRIKDDVRIRG